MNTEKLRTTTVTFDGAQRWSQKCNFIFFMPYLKGLVVLDYDIMTLPITQFLKTASF